VRPYVAWNRRRTNAGPTGFEVGYKSLRLENDFSAGVDADTTARTHFKVYGRFVRTRWDADARYQTSSLRENLNRDGTSLGTSFSYSVTPLTAIGVSVEAQRDRFQFSPVRSGDTFRVTPMIEFASPALIWGSARVGYERFVSRETSAGHFAGPFANVNLGYGSPDGTLVKLFVSRELQFSYDPILAHYVSTNVSLTAARRVAASWDSAVFAGRYALDFRPPFDVGHVTTEVVTEYGGAIAYRLSQWTRLGASVERARKTGAGGFSAVRMIGFLTLGSGRFQRLDRPTPFER
jgi:hypothetical protein